MQQAKKKKGHFTIIVIPHTEESILSFRIPLFAFQLLSVFVLVFLLVLFVNYKSYMGLKEDADTISGVREQNRVLNEQIDLLTQETEDLKLQLEEVEVLSREVRVLMELDEQEDAEETSPYILAGDSGYRLLSGRGGNQSVDRALSNISFLHDALPQKASELAQLKEGVIEYQQELAATPSIWPASGRVTSEFGPRRSPITGRREFHYGIDIAAPRGTYIYAAANGVVSVSTYRRGLGNVIVVEHGYGYSTLYAHLSGFAVSAGDTVHKGQLIGYMGSTGSSTGPHLHYEVHVNGVAVNPRDYLP